MFELTKNEFVTKGVCKYEDECGNKVFMKRDGKTEFVAKLRPRTAGIYIDEIHMDAFDNVNGVNLSIKTDFPSQGVDEDTKKGIEGFVEIIKHWREMLAVVSHVVNSDVLDNAAKGEDNRKAFDLIRANVTMLNEYAELKPAIQKLFTFG
jgi:hypothetical protein